MILRGKLAEPSLVSEARRLGPIGGLELVADKRAKRVFEPAQIIAARAVQFAQEEGIVVRAIASDTVAFCRPFIISKSEIGELFTCRARALDRRLDWVAREQR